MTYAALYIDGEPVAIEDPELERVQVSLPGEDGLDRCRHCGEEISDYGDGWMHDEGPEPLKVCGGGSDDDASEAEPEPLNWANSAAITLDGEEDAIHVSISVGDPRGAFVFTIRKMPDTAADKDVAGRLIMHTPYPGEGLPHEKLTEDHPGTYVIG